MRYAIQRVTVDDEATTSIIEDTPEVNGLPGLYVGLKSGMIVLFYAPNDGVVMHPGSTVWWVGEQSVDWVACTDATHWRRLGPEESIVLFGG